MKIIFFILIIVPFIAFSQNAKWNPNKLDDKIYDLDAEFVAPTSITLPFSSIKIIDSRFDTSKLGFTASAKFFLSKTNQFKKIKLKKGVARAIEDYYQDYYKNAFTNNNFELLIVIKKFWFSFFDAGKRKSQDLLNGSEFRDGSFLCKWEYYIGKNGSYVPVKRTDTTFQLSDELNKNIKIDFEEKKSADLKFFLKALIEMNDFEKNILSFDNQPKKTMAQINEFNNKRFNVPIITDSIIKKGVYLNIEEFKKNNPSIIVFSEKNMRYGTFKKEEYLEDEKGNTINPYWCYSNGEWIKYGLYTHDYIYRTNNTFEFFSAEDVFSVQQSNGPITHTSKTKLYLPVQIDMETGDVY